MSFKEVNLTDLQLNPWQAIGNDWLLVTAGDAAETVSGLYSAVAAAILKSVRPSVAAIKDEKERKAVADALIACVTAGEDSDITKLIQTVQKNAQRVADRKPEANLDAIQKAYDNMNPHRKENKE